MTENINISVIYDIFHYLSIYFGRRYQSKIDIASEVNRVNSPNFFDLFLKKVGIPDDSLCLFTMNNNKGDSIAQKIIIDIINSNGDFDAFYKYISDKSRIVELIIEHFYNEITPEQKQAVIECDTETIFILNESVATTFSVKYHIAYALMYTEKFVSKLSVFAHNACEMIFKIHKEYRQDKKLPFSALSDKEVIREICIGYNVTASCFDSASCAISLLSTNVFIYLDFNPKIFILGLDFNKSMINTNYQRSLKIFCKLMSDDLRYDIVEAFIINGRLTASQVSKIVHTSMSNAFNHITKMYNEGMLNINMTEGRSVYYSLSAKYFDRIRLNINLLAEDVTANLIHYADINNI